MKRENMTFYYYGLEIPKDVDDSYRHPYSDYFTNVDTEYEVDKNKVIEALIEILRETPEFVDMEDEDFENYVEDHWEELGDKYYENLRDYFEGEAKEKAAEEYEEPEYDPAEPDPEEDFYDESFSKGMFEKLDSEDPDCSYSTYHKYDVMEGIGSYDPEGERYEYITSKSVLDADGFYTDYTLYKDTQENKYITIFGDNDIYDPETTEADAEFETKEEALKWFDSYKGFEEEEETEEEDLLEEDKDPYIPLTVNDRFDPNGYKEDTSASEVEAYLNESATAEGKIVVTNDPYYVIAYSDGESTYYYSDKGSYNVDFRGDRYYDIKRISDELDDAAIFDTEDEAEDYLSTANKYLFYFYKHIDDRDSRYGGGLDFDFNDGSVEDLIDWLGSGMKVVKIGGDEPKVYKVTSDEVTDQNDRPLYIDKDLEDADGVFLKNIKISDFR